MAALTEGESPGRARPLACVLYGLAVGSADAVPGISGGTVALLLGIYARLLASLSTILRAPALLRHPEGRAELGRALAFLAPLGIGVVTAYFVATRFLVGPTDAPGLLRRGTSAPYFYAGFSGLVLASVVVVWRRIPHPGRRLVALAALGAAVSGWFAGLPHVSGDPPTWALVPGGAAAIGVMLLPGVSGSLLLVVLGQYTKVSAAVHDRDVTTLLVFGVGLVCGVLLVVPFLRRLLERHPRPTHAFLCGLMAGSLRALWPWKEQYDPKAGRLLNHLDLWAADGPHAAGIAGAVLLGALAVVLLGRVEAWVAARGGEGGG